MQFSCYTRWSELPDSAEELFDSAAKESLFFSRPWFETLSKTALIDDQKLILACAVEEKTLLAILPLRKGAADNWHSLTHNYSSLFSLIIADHNQREILNCLVKGLSELPHKSIALMPIDPRDPIMLLLQQVMQSHGFECLKKFRFYNWFHRTQGEKFSEYISNRPGKLRNTISRKQRKLEREHDYEIRLYLGAQVPEAMDDYYTVYKASWKADEQFGRIMDSLIHRFSSLGWSRLAILYVEDQPIAAQIWLVLHDKAYIFRLVYNQRWKQFSPGSILTQYLMQYVMENDAVQEIDFLMGNEQYKQDWMSQRRERWALTFIKPEQPQSAARHFFALTRKALFNRKKET